MIAINKIKTLILIGPENGGAYNPAKNKICIIFNAPEAGKVKVGMYDIFGSRVQDNHGQSVIKGLNKFDLDVSNLTQGEYLVELLFDGKNITLKQADKLLVGLRD